MFPLVRVVLRTFCSGVRSRRDLMLENLALRQQLMVLQRATCPYQKIHPWPAVALSRANLSDRPDGCAAHFKARQRVTTDFPTSLHHSAGHNLRGATLIVQFTVTDELRLPDLLAQMF